MTKPQFTQESREVRQLTLLSETPQVIMILKCYHTPIVRQLRKLIDTLFFLPRTLAKRNCLETAT